VLKVMALGFFLVAVGLFVIPHDAGLAQLISEAANSGADDHKKALAGLTLIIGGLVLAIIGGWIYHNTDKPRLA
jgi:hypothetical protein